MTGIYDHPGLSGTFCLLDSLGGELEKLKEVVIKVNEEFAEKLGINKSTACTTLKPEGTTSSLANSASGIHPRHSRYYIRSVRQDNKDALTQFLKDQGVPWEPCAIRPDSTTVFYFPVKSPESAVVRDGVTAIGHLNLWDIYNHYWSEHQVSVTVNVREHEWVDVASWVYANWDSITGISFLPYDGGSYKQAPFQECTEEEYLEAASKMPKTIDWNKLSEYELDDTSDGVRELACVGGACEVSF